MGWDLPRKWNVMVENRGHIRMQQVILHKEWCSGRFSGRTVIIIIVLLPTFYSKRLSQCSFDDISLNIVFTSLLVEKMNQIAVTSSLFNTTFWVMDEMSNTLFRPLYSSSEYPCVGDCRYVTLESSLFIDSYLKR